MADEPKTETPDGAINGGFTYGRETESRSRCGAYARAG